MQIGEAQEKQQFLGWMLVVLLTAVALRLFALAHIPPGLTHDEADHGLTALAILEGTRAVYFTIGHGREPLYDYVTALVMAGIGPTFMAGRLTAVFASLLTIAGMAAWVRRAFDWQTAVLTAAGLSVSFWPLMAARQSLRSIMLPLLFVLTVLFFWRALTRSPKLEARSRKSESLISDIGHRITDHRSPITDYGIAGLCLGLTFYTYIPARILWLVFPLTLGYVALAARPLLARAWRGVLLMLVLAGILALPLFLYLAANPEAEIRIRELSGPLTAVTQGNLTPLWQNMREGAGILFWRGDDFWRYNIPGRPLLGLVMALLAGGGLVLAGWWALRPLIKRHPDTRLRRTPALSGDPWLPVEVAAFLALCWLLMGLVPALVTGASLSTTQAMGMQPVLYLFPALAIRNIGNSQITQISQMKNLHNLRNLCIVFFRLAVVFLFVGTAVLTSRDYFRIWANAPEVRVQYEAAMTAVMRYLNEQDVTDVAISTITPGQYHTPALARVMLTNDEVTPRWFDGRTGLLIPHAPTALIILTGFAPLPEALHGYLGTATSTGNGGSPLSAGVSPITIPQPATDLDRPLTVYQLHLEDWQAAHQPATAVNPPVPFGEAAALIGYDVADTAVAPGRVLQLITWWQLNVPVEGIRLFTHLTEALTGADGVPIAQADLLAAPGESWMAGDRLLQWHEITIPPDTPPGQYPLIVGWYTCLDTACKQTRRLLTTTAQDHFTIQEITVTP
ncbi:MAG: hypothetical protein KJ069_25865 [Anaerolineae bacterium]|nr:hypothetical protein [Anaerolineae bacterium]